jgi:hypothetical protein
VRRRGSKARWFGCNLLMCGCDYVSGSGQIFSARSCRRRWGTDWALSSVLQPNISSECSWFFKLKPQHIKYIQSCIVCFLWGSMAAENNRSTMFHDAKTTDSVTTLEWYYSHPIHSIRNIEIQNSNVLTENIHVKSAVGILTS